MKRRGEIRSIRLYRRYFWRGIGRAAVLVDVFEFLEMVVPGELQGDRSNRDNAKRDRRGPQPPRHDVDGQGHQGDLPDDANRDVEHVAGEIFVLLKRRVFLLHFLQDRSPEAPW